MGTRKRQTGRDEPVLPPPTECREGLAETSEFTNNYVQWLVDGDKFIPLTPTVATLPSGHYDIKLDRSFDRYVLVLSNPVSEELLHLPMKEFDEVLDDIRSFWDRRADYDKYGYIYKRGILLYGPPGCGKSSLVKLLADDLVKNENGIIINIGSSDDLLAFDDIMKSVREVEPNRRIIVTIEDIDNFANEENHRLTQLLTLLLNVLDGKKQFDNIVIIATTNYPELLEERISNRPSRFDLRVEIGPPKMKAREFYIRTKLKKSDLKKLDIEMWLRETAGFTIDHLKELVSLVFVHKRPFDFALARVKGMIKNQRLQNKSDSIDGKLGFGASKNNEEDDDR